MSPTKILLADDHAMVRDMLQTMLDKEPSLKVVATADDGTRLIAVARSTRPDVVVLDIDMPGLCCFDATRRVRAMLPEVRIVFLSAHTNDRFIEQALSVGAQAYLRKEEPLDVVVSAIKKVVAGAAYFSPEVLARLVFDKDKVSLADRDTRSKVSMLTQREREVLRYIAHGMAKKEMAEIMHIGTKTVEKHTENIMSKLDIHDRVQLARFALREGLAEL